MKKILLVLLCIILAGGILMGLMESRQEERETAQKLRELNEQLAPLYSRQRELQAERDAMVESTNARLSGMSTLSFLLTDLSDDFFNTAEPSLRNAGVPVVMVLSMRQFPGEAGQIPLGVFQEKLGSGWDYCVAWDGSDEFDQWYDDMARKLRAKSIAMPESLYCADGSYSVQLAGLAQARGFHTIVHSGEEGQALVETKVGELWRPGFVSWDSNGVKARLQECML